MSLFFRRCIWPALFLILSPFAVMSNLAFAAVPDSYEARYSEAVVSFQSGDSTTSLKIIRELIAQDPTVFEFYELKALVLKSAQKESDAAAVYSQLIDKKIKAGRPNIELAPYYFELGVLAQKAGKIEKSNTYLKFSLKQKFNRAPCLMYLAINAFNANDLLAAETFFKEVTQSDVRDLIPSANLYLGQVYLRTGFSSGAISKFNETIEVSEKIIEDPEAAEESKKLAQGTADSAGQILATYDQAKFFATLATSTSYDSNVLTVPSSVASSSQTTGKSSFTQALNAGLGYMTAARSDWQYVPSYRGSFNYNTNRDARTAEFINSYLSLYITRRPLERLSYGLKTEGSFIFRNEVDATTDTGKFKRFSTGLSIGPYIKFEIASMWTVGAEVSLDPTTYHQDQYVSSDSKRTGTGYSGTAYVQHSRGGKYFNPYLSAKFTQDNAKGSEYKATSYKFSLNSPMKVLPKLEVVPSVAYSVTEYYKRTSGIRNDALLDILLQANYQLALKWTLLGSIGITANSSNIPDSYSYDRQLLTIGVSYSVF